MPNHRIAVIAGDGIGPEVMDASREVIDTAEKRFGFTADLHDFALGGQHYLRTGELWTEPLAEQLRECDAILFGSMGDPAVPPGILERGIILQMRLDFEQAVNFRPVRLYPAVESPVRNVTPENCDMVIIRENTEGAYVGRGSTVHRGTTNAVALQESVNTYHAIERVVDFSFRLAQTRRGRLTLCHKKNILVEAGYLWQDIVDELSAKYPDVELDYAHVDAMCFHLPITPDRFDVIVTDNLFGDIITDLGAVIQGGLGVAASANLNLDGSAPSMFEPIHGSAPDIAGRGLANPTGAILSTAMCLASLGELEAAKAIEASAAAVLASLSPTLGSGTGASTAEVGRRVAELVGERTETFDSAISSSVMDQLAGMSIRRP